jgi:hypothetical protein
MAYKFGYLYFLYDFNIWLSLDSYHQTDFMPDVKCQWDSEKVNQLLNLQSYSLHTAKLIRKQLCITTLYQLFSYEQFKFLRSEDL